MPYAGWLAGCLEIEEKEWGRRRRRSTLSVSITYTSTAKRICRVK